LYLNIEAQFFNPVIISVDNHKAVHIRPRYLAGEGNDYLRNHGKYLPVNKAQIFGISESSETQFKVHHASQTVEATFGLTLDNILKFEA